MNENGTRQEQKLLDLEITELHKKLKLVSVSPKAQAETTIHARECCRQHGGRDCSNCGNGANQAAAQRRKVHCVAKICKLLRHIQLLIRRLFGVNRPAFSLFDVDFRIAGFGS
jgi:hypothetical protein